MELFASCAVIVELSNNLANTKINTRVTMEQLELGTSLEFGKQILMINKNSIFLAHLLSLS